MPKRGEVLNIVLITRFFPPEPSGGARRPFLYTQALREIGHRVIVVSPHGNADDPDHIRVEHPVSHINDGPEDNSAIARESALRSLARDWLLWPEPEIRWYRRVEKELLSRNIAADWLITTSPPEAGHCIGARLAAHMGTRWLAEFRDTWINTPHRAVLRRSAMRRFIERRIAKNALKSVTSVSAVSEAVMRDVRALVPAGTPELVIGHFSAPPDTQYHFEGEDIHLLHAGGFALSDSGRDLEAMLGDIGGAGRADVHLHIIGRLTEEESSIINVENRFKVTHHGVVPLAVSQAMQVGADALLLITPEKSHALPGKYAEYRMAGRPILYKGGGEWLGLVRDKDAITPLQEGLKRLEKGTRAELPESLHLSHEAAAQELSQFLSKHI